MTKEQESSSLPLGHENFLNRVSGLVETKRLYTYIFSEDLQEKFEIYDGYASKRIALLKLSHQSWHPLTSVNINTNSNKFDLSLYTQPSKKQHGYLTLNRNYKSNGTEILVGGYDCDSKYKIADAPEFKDLPTIEEIDLLKTIDGFLSQAEGRSDFSYPEIIRKNSSS